MQYILSLLDVYPKVHPENCTEWTYWDSFLFAFSVITTIGKNFAKLDEIDYLNVCGIKITWKFQGYGHRYPRTDGGKMICITYALIGVPINGTLIASIASFFDEKVSISFEEIFDTL